MLKMLAREALILVAVGLLVRALVGQSLSIAHYMVVAIVYMIGLIAGMMEGASI